MDIRCHGRGIQHIVGLEGLWPRGIFLGALFGHLDKTMVKDFYHNHLASVFEGFESSLAHWLWHMHASLFCSYHHVYVSNSEFLGTNSGVESPYDFQTICILSCPDFSIQGNTYTSTWSRWKDYENPAPLRAFAHPNSNIHADPPILKAAVHWPHNFTGWNCG